MTTTTIVTAYEQLMREQRKRYQDVLDEFGKAYLAKAGAGELYPTCLPYRALSEINSVLRTYGTGVLPAFYYGQANKWVKMEVIPKSYEADRIAIQKDTIMPVFDMTLLKNTTYPLLAIDNGKYVVHGARNEQVDYVNRAFARAAHNRACELRIMAPQVHTEEQFKDFTMEAMETLTLADAALSTEKRPEALQRKLLRETFYMTSNAMQRVWKYGLDPTPTVTAKIQDMEARLAKCEFSPFDKDRDGILIGKEFEEIRKTLSEKGVTIPQDDLQFTYISADAQRAIDEWKKTSGMRDIEIGGEVLPDDVAAMPSGRRSAAEQKR